MINETTILRDKELIDRFEHLLYGIGVNEMYIRRDKIVSMIAQQPAPRFYICPKLAERYVRNFYNGVKVKTNTKIKMVKDLVETYERIKVENPNMAQHDVWDLVVEQPAKSFYMTEVSIGQIVYGWRKRK